VDPAAGEERVFFGECSGALADSRRGTRGFGYDPAFLPSNSDSDSDSDGAEGRTMAELSDEEKDAISHRGAAVRELVRWLRT
jgi:XTP/dITP diphosphohydrolase